MRSTPSHASPPAVLDLIGNTPLVEVTRFDTGCCQLFLKLESQNPGGSIKDRIGLAMIEAAERDGRLPPGGTVIEATAGNTGLGLALVARAKGYRVVLVVPDKMSSEKVLHLKALGAEVHTTRSDVAKGHPDYYQDVAARLARARAPGSYYIDQFNNPANPLAHESSTGPEIWQQTGHASTPSSAASAPAARSAGLKRYFSRVSPETEFVLADPKGSVLADYIAQARSAPPARGPSRASARTSSPRSRTSTACAPPTRSTTRRASPPRANCSSAKASSPARRPARCSPPRCATAARRPRRSAS